MSLKNMIVRAKMRLPQLLTSVKIIVGKTKLATEMMSKVIVVLATLILIMSLNIMMGQW